jgi:hypothetical protein
MLPVLKNEGKKEGRKEGREADYNLVHVTMLNTTGNCNT